MRRFPLFGPLLVWALVFVIWGPLAVRAQTVIRGVVTNAETEAPIPQATLQVDGTYTGTVTNDEGRYALRVDSLPVTVVVQHIGYETARFRLTDATDRRQSVALQPSSVEMDGVVVTGSRNPGRDIMRRVIEQKKTWWDALETYDWDAPAELNVAHEACDRHAGSGDVGFAWVDPDGDLVGDVEGKLAEARMPDPVEMYVSRALGVGVAATACSRSE